MFKFQTLEEVVDSLPEGFNPLDRVKFVQINLRYQKRPMARDTFQSPRSGQICSNLIMVWQLRYFAQMSFNPLDRVKFVQIEEVNNNQMPGGREFQSPRSGQICSNFQAALRDQDFADKMRFNPLDRVKFVQIT